MDIRIIDKEGNIINCSRGSIVIVNRRALALQEGKEITRTIFVSEIEGEVGYLLKHIEERVKAAAMMNWRDIVIDIRDNFEKKGGANESKG